jgi:hypothetical protein
MVLRYLDIIFLAISNGVKSNCIIINIILHFPSNLVFNKLKITSKLKFGLNLF